jgi:hypothetical protein
MNKNEERVYKKMWARKDRFYTLSIEERIQKYGIEEYDDNIVYNREVLLLRQQRRPLARLIAVAKYRAKQYNLEFNIKESDLELPIYCPILELKLEYSPRERLDNSYSLDRVDPSKGYVKGNVRVISWKANRMKNHLSLDFLERVIKYIKDHQERNIN